MELVSTTMSPSKRGAPSTTNQCGDYIHSSSHHVKHLSQSEHTVGTVSTDETRDSSFTRRGLLRLNHAGDNVSLRSSSISSDDSDHSDHSPSNVPVPTSRALLHNMPLHRDRQRWRNNYDSLSFLKSIEAPSDDEQEDEVSCDEPIAEDEQETKEGEADLEMLCSRDSKKIKLLGQGAYGDVYQVIHRRKAYALKVCSKFDLITEGAVEAVLQERNIARDLHHPFLCSLVASRQDEHFLYMLQEYCPGGELYSLLERLGGKMRESSGRFYIACIADAIAHLHERLIVHRDLKPENILIDCRGYPQLIDFGCAKRIEAANRMTLTMCGTPRFVSPEMIDPSNYGGGHSFATDYWALGILMYEMLMGSNPYEYDGMTEMEVYQSILDEDFTPALSDEHSSSAQDFLGKLLVHNPKRRLGRKHDSRVLQHRWFADVDMTNLRKKPFQVTPWAPDLSDSSDSHYFDDWDKVVESKFSQSYPSLSTSQRHLFANF